MKYRTVQHLTSIFNSPNKDHDGYTPQYLTQNDGFLKENPPQILGLDGQVADWVGEEKRRVQKDEFGQGQQKPDQVPGLVEIFDETSARGIRLDVTMARRDSGQGKWLLTVVVD